MRPGSVPDGVQFLRSVWACALIHPPVDANYTKRLTPATDEIKPLQTSATLDRELIFFFIMITKS